MNEDKVIQKLMEHDETLSHIKENMAAKDDVRGLSNGQDQIISILKRLDEERVFTTTP